MKRVIPQGHIKEFLNLQLDGLTGHMYAAGYPFDLVEWGKPDIIVDNENPSWWVYEQVAYWMDGALRCAIALEQQSVIAQIAQMIYNVIDNADEDGYLGPKFLRESDGWNRWPHVVFFRACMALYEYNQDERIVVALSKHYLGSNIDFSNYRDVLNVEIMLWLYGKTQDNRLLELAEKTYVNYNEKCMDDLSDKIALSNKKPRAHGVSYNEYSKLGAILYMYTGKSQYLNVSVRAVAKIDEFFTLPGGANCSDEFMIGNEYYHSIETCDVTDYTWNLFYLLKATKNPIYADKIEKCIFNAGIGCVLEDFKALQYFSCANQIVMDGNSNHNTFFKGSEWMSYRPNPGTECCPGNVNRFMPNYLLNSWQQEGDKVFSLVYAASEFQSEINGQKVCIKETTDYPINEKIKFEIDTETPFKFFVRIPQWAVKYRILIDGKEVVVESKNAYVCLDINGSCEVKLDFESEIEKHIKAGKIWLSKGVLTYSFGQKGKRIKEGNDEYPNYSIYPDGEWRYAIYNKALSFVPCENFTGWDLNLQLPYIEADAKIIENWELETQTAIRRCINLYEKKYKVLRKKCVFTPKLLPKHKLKLGTDMQKIRLYPYGACKVRLTVFNHLQEK